MKGVRVYDHVPLLCHPQILSSLLGNHSEILTATHVVFNDKYLCMNVSRRELTGSRVSLKTLQQEVTVYDYY